MARLLISTDEPGAAETVVELATDAVTIGREPTNAVALPSEGKASRRHCQIVPVSGGYELVDLKSTNGTRVNGQAVERRYLNSGDVIEVGKTRIKFEDSKAASGSGTACFLEHVDGPNAGKRVPLTASRTTFGRRETNTIVLTDRMSSGHHAEVVKDLNGFTLRDLGSTNGTLVNGQPVTEQLLTHGTRIRIGNSRFVFKDPSMADVDVALASVDEDDAGWGMMGEIDLSRARGGGLGLLAAAVLLLAVGAAAFFLGSRPAETATGVRGDDNIVADGTFESADSLAWGPESDSPASADRVSTSQKGSHLRVKHTGDLAGVGRVVYSEEVEAPAGRRYRVRARVRREGEGAASFAVEWYRRGNRRTGATAVEQSLDVGPATSSWSTVERVVRKPGWAERGRLVVRVAPSTSLLLDDVSMRPDGATEADSRLGLPGDVDASLATSGTVDLVRNVTVLALGASPWAKMSDGRVLGGPASFVAESATASADGFDVRGRLVGPGESGGEGAGAAANVRWRKEKDGLRAHVEVAGAVAVGLSADVPRAHLAEGVGVVGAFGSRRLPPEATPPLEGVAKSLLGDPKLQGARPPTLLAFDVSGAEAAGSLELRDADDAGLLRALTWIPGASGDVRIVTWFEGERQRAGEEFREASRLLESQPGKGIERLRAVAVAHPDQEELAAEALALAAKREAKAFDDLRAATESLERFRVYRDLDSLRDVEQRADTLGAQFPYPTEGDATNLDLQVRDVVAAARAARATFEVASAGAEVRRWTRLAQILEDEPGFAALAAVYYDAIVRRFGALAGATGTPEAEEVARRVAEARTHREALLARPDVRKAVPNVPNVTEQDPR